MMMEWFYSLYEDRETKKLNFGKYNVRDKFNMIICKQTEKGRRFAMFADPYKLMDYSNSLEPEDRCLYEVIVGKRARKPYFDIDVDLAHDPEINRKVFDSYIEEFVENIKDFMSTYTPKIIVFTSHREDKLSYHIVVDRVYLKTNEDSKIFADKVLTDNLKEYVDGRVYNAVQQLRIIGSRKYGKKNVKKVDFMLSDNFYIPKTFKPREREIYILASSLVCITEGCKLLEMEHPKKSNSKRMKGAAKVYDVDLALDVLSRHYDNFEPKQIRESNGNILVELKSSSRYMCQIHKRYHEHENAFITIKGMMKNVQFDCRRIERHEKHLAPQFIGCLFQSKNPINYGIKFKLDREDEN